jgi:hypothetical protein
MPATLEDLASSAGLPGELVRRVAEMLAGSSAPFRELVDPALELLAGVIPEWPLLEEWNRWCAERGMSFLVWQPRRAGLSGRQRLEAFVHVIMMLGAKERNMVSYRKAGIAAVEVVMAGDDCVICDGHRHRVVPLDARAADHLPPFHPWCRCGTLPRLA